MLLISRQIQTGGRQFAITGSGHDPPVYSGALILCIINIIMPFAVIKFEGDHIITNKGIHGNSLCETYLRRTRGAVTKDILERPNISSYQSCLPPTSLVGATEKFVADSNFRHFYTNLE